MAATALSFAPTDIGVTRAAINEATDPKLNYKVVVWKKRPRHQDVMAHYTFTVSNYDADNHMHIRGRIWGTAQEIAPLLDRVCSEQECAVKKLCDGRDIVHRPTHVHIMEGGIDPNKVLVTGGYFDLRGNPISVLKTHRGATLHAA